MAQGNLLTLQIVSLFVVPLRELVRRDLKRAVFDGRSWVARLLHPTHALGVVPLALAERIGIASALAVVSAVPGTLAATWKGVALLVSL